MKYRIDIQSEIKYVALPGGSEITTEATDCDMELWAEIERLRAALQGKDTQK